MARPMLLVLDEDGDDDDDDGDDDDNNDGGNTKADARSRSSSVASSRCRLDIAWGRRIMLFVSDVVVLRMA